MIFIKEVYIISYNLRYKITIHEKLANFKDFKEKLLSNTQNANTCKYFFF